MIHVLYENEAWMPPLRRALAERGLPVTEHFAAEGVLDLQADPAEGVWLNRMSPSAHTRGHGGGIHYVRELLGLLEERGARVVNGSHPFALEVSKVRQHAALESAGILTPRTLAGPNFEEPFDGVTLLQQYVEPPSRSITRVEIVDGELIFAMRSATDGGFELCPADACNIGDAFCPVGETAATQSKFTPEPMDPRDPLIQAYIRFCAAHQLDVAGIEFVTGADGQRYTYDINMNTNYNSDVEQARRGLKSA